MRKNMEKLSSTVIETRHIPYFNPCMYIKVFPPRKLYANASEETLELEEID